jgi:small-conductance mechanosensitive channel
MTLDLNSPVMNIIYAIILTCIAYVAVPQSREFIKGVVMIPVKFIKGILKMVLGWILMVVLMLIALVYIIQQAGINIF